MEVKTFPLGGAALVLMASSLNRNVFPQQFCIAGNLGDVVQLKEGNPQDLMTTLRNFRDPPTGNKSQKMKRKEANNTFQLKTLCKPLFYRQKCQGRQCLLVANIPVFPLPCELA